MSQNIDKAIDAVKGLIAALPQTERREFASKISACFASGELTSVGDDAVSAAAGRMTMIQARAQWPQRAHLITQLKKRAERMGYLIDESKPINLAEFDRITAGRVDLIDQRFSFKTDAARLGLC